MATRFYYSLDSFTTVTIAEQGAWDYTVADHVKCYMKTTNPGDMGFVLEAYTGGSSTYRFRTFVTEPMSGGIAFSAGTTWKWVGRIKESSTSANVYSLFHIAIVSEDGATTRAEFSSKQQDGTEAATTSTSRSNLNTGGIVYTTVAGDRLVFECGWEQGAGTYTATLSRGNVDASDLDDSDADTGINNPWLETSATITFGGGDPAPPATNEDWDATVYISGVLDEFI